MTASPRATAAASAGLSASRRSCRNQRSVASTPSSLACYIRLDMETDWPPIYLAWRQRLAAFWSIAWPSMAAISVLGYLITWSWPADAPMWAFQLSALVVYFAFPICQVFFVQRLVRKKYRSFRIDVVRDDVTAEPRLSLTETVQLWFRVAWPQGALMLTLIAAGVVLAAASGQEAASHVSGA